MQIKITIIFICLAIFQNSYVIHYFPMTEVKGNWTRRF